MDAQLIPMSQNNFIPFSYEGMRLQEACFLNGTPYFTGRGIGEFLEYEHPDIAINKVVKRNPHIKEFSTLTSLVSVEGNREVTREVRVYDPVGLQLIINKSNQPRALAFQIAAAHLVMAFMKGEIKPSKWSTKGDRVSAIRQIQSHPPTYKRKELIKDLADQEGVALQTVYRWVEGFGGIKTQKGTKRQRSTKGAHKSRPEYIQAMDYLKEHPTAKGAEIKKHYQSTVSTDRINAWIREA